MVGRSLFGLTSTDFAHDVSDGTRRTLQNWKCQHRPVREWVQAQYKATWCTVSTQVAIQIFSQCHIIDKQKMKPFL